jgi:hypothetical protein
MRSQFLTQVGSIALLALVSSSPAESFASEPSAGIDRRSVALQHFERVSALLESEREELAGLRAQLAAASDDATAATLQATIEATKLRTRQNVLRVQIDWAKSAGMPERTRSLERSLAQLEQQIARRGARAVGNQPAAEH